MIPKRRTKSQRRQAARIEQLLNEAIAGQDDELARRARMVAAGEVDAAQMTPAEIWEFVEPDELFKQFDFGRSCPGHVNFDKDYHDWAIAERGQLLERSTALINAMLLPLGKDMMDLLLDSAMAGRE